MALEDRVFSGIFPLFFGVLDGDVSFGARLVSDGIPFLVCHGGGELLLQGGGGLAGRPQVGPCRGEGTLGRPELPFFTFTLSSCVFGSEGQRTTTAF